VVGGVCMRKLLFVLLTAVLLVGCSDSGEVESTSNGSATETDKKEEMTDTAVKMYLSQITGKYSLAFTTSANNEQKNNQLNEAITDINLAVIDIQDNYESSANAVSELIDLSEHLLDTINYELLGETESAYDSAYESGIIIRELSDEYLEGELPVGIRNMIE